MESIPGPMDGAEQMKRNLLGQITALENDLALLRTRLQSLETASQTLASSPSPRQRRHMPRPALAPLILSLLPDDSALMSIDDVISGVLTAEGLDVDDRPARSKTYRRANLCLNKLRAEGLVVSRRIGSGRMDWALAPAAPGDGCGGRSGDQSGE